MSNEKNKQHLLSCSYHCIYLIRYSDQNNLKVAASAIKQESAMYNENRRPKNCKVAK